MGFRLWFAFKPQPRSFSFNKGKEVKLLCQALSEQILGTRRKTMSSLYENLKSDVRHLAWNKPSRARIVALILTNRGLHAVFLYRLAHALRKNKVPFLPLVLARLSQLFFAVDISPSAQLGPGIVIVHGFGLVIGEKVVIEGSCYLYHGVTLGARGVRWIDASRIEGHPFVEKGVLFGAGAKVLGPIRVGQGSIIGANAVVIEDVPAHAVVAGVPARVVRQR